MTAVDPLAGYVLGDRVPELEGPHSRMHRATKADGEGSFLVKLVPATDLSPERVEAQRREDERFLHFLGQLSSEEEAVFVLARAMGTVEFDGTPWLFRITDFAEGSRYLTAVDEVVAAHLRDTRSAASTLARLARAFAALQTRGYPAAWLCAADVVFVPEPLEARVVYYGSRFLDPRHKALHRAPPSLQALWRVHPDLDAVHEPDARAAAFSLAALAWRVVAGALPYEKPGAFVVVEATLRPLSAVYTRLEDDLRRGLARDPAARASLDEVVAALCRAGVADDLATIHGNPVPLELAAARRPRLPPLALRQALLVARVAELGWLLRKAVRLADDPVRVREVGASLRGAATRLGPVFVKLAQIAATRKDLLPELVCDELAHLQSAAHASMSFADVRAVLEHTWRGARLEDVCLSFREKPLGVASVGQVYRARLRDGEEVVIKVRKPEVDRVEEDLAVVVWLVALAHRALPRLRPLDLPTMIGQFARAVKDEIRFEAEVLNLREVEALLADDDGVVTPAVFPALCGERVLVMGFLGGGLSVDDPEALTAAGLDRLVVARRFLDVFLEMMLRHGVFHADPHPGNLLVMPDGAVGLLDFGMVGRITSRRRFELLYLLTALLSGRADRVVTALQLMDALPAGADSHALENELSALLRQARLVLASGGRGALGVILQRLTGLMPEYGVRIPADLQLVIKALVTVESSVVALAGDVDAAAEVQAGLGRLVRRTVDAELDKGLAKLAAEYAGGWLMDAAAMGRRALDRAAMPHPAPDGDRAGSALLAAGLLVGGALLAPTAGPLSLAGLGMLLLGLVVGARRVLRG